LRGVICIGESASFRGAARHCPLAASATARQHRPWLQPPRMHAGARSASLQLSCRAPKPHHNPHPPQKQNSYVISRGQAAELQDLLAGPQPPRPAQRDALAGGEHPAAAAASASAARRRAPSLRDAVALCSERLAPRPGAEGGGGAGGAPATLQAALEDAGGEARRARLGMGETGVDGVAGPSASL
jgi:hypothetical protein